MSSKPRVRVPKSAKAGDVFEIKTLITHKMESGRRKGKDGAVIPRMIINSFVCTFEGQEVFSGKWAPAVAANPYLSFFAKAEKSGTFAFTWTDDEGKTYQTEAALTVA